MTLDAFFSVKNRHLSAHFTTRVAALHQCQIYQRLASIKRPTPMSKK